MSAKLRAPGWYRAGLFTLLGVDQRLVAVGGADQQVEGGGKGDADDEQGDRPVPTGRSELGGHQRSPVTS